MKRIKNVLFGLFLMAAGFIIFLDLFEYININFYVDGWWTFFVIIPCAIDAIDRDNKIPNFIGIAFGIIVLLACQKVLTIVSLLKLMVPAILVFAGLAMLLKGAKNDKPNNNF